MTNKQWRWHNSASLGGLRQPWRSYVRIRIVIVVVWLPVFWFEYRSVLNPTMLQRWRQFVRWKRCSSSSLHSSAAGAHTSSCCYTIALTVSRCLFTCTHPCWHTCTLVLISRSTAWWTVIYVPVSRSICCVAVAERQWTAMVAAMLCTQLEEERDTTIESMPTDRLLLSNITSCRTLTCAAAETL